MLYFYTRRLLAPIPEGGNDPAIGAGVYPFTKDLSQCVEICTAAVLFLFVNSKDKEKVAIVAKKARKCVGS